MIRMTTMRKRFSPYEERRTLFLVMTVLCLSTLTPLTSVHGAMTVTTTCDPMVIAQELVGPGIIVESASITGGKNANGDCLQAGIFSNGASVTQATLDGGDDVVFVDRGVTLSTGSVSFAEYEDFYDINSQTCAFSDPRDSVGVAGNSMIRECQYAGIDGQRYENALSPELAGLCARDETLGTLNFFRDVQSVRFRRNMRRRFFRHLFQS